MKDIQLTLEELAESVVTHLEQLGLLEKGADRRISARPDGRTLRYYTSLGLLDPPQIEKRQARYGAHHLLQATVIKALQSEGYSLAQIQQRLFGLDQSGLETILEQVRKAPQERSYKAFHWLEIQLEPGLSLKMSPDWKLRNREQLLGELEAVLTQIENEQRISKNNPGEKVS
jgi:DNA-binding transcriptional MerR regulator